MALTINELKKKPADGSVYTSDFRICLDADGKACDCDDAAAVSLLVGEGCQIPTDLAAAHGLIAGVEPVAAPAPVAESASEPAAELETEPVAEEQGGEKERPGAPADKSRKGPRGTK